MRSPLVEKKYIYFYAFVYICLYTKDISKIYTIFMIHFEKCIFLGVAIVEQLYSVGIVFKFIGYICYIIIHD